MGATAAGADLTIRHAADAGRWPASSEVMRFEFRDGLVLVRTTLVSPSGLDAMGLLIADTGAPALTVSASVWNALALDTLADTTANGGRRSVSSRSARAVSDYL